MPNRSLLPPEEDVSALFINSGVHALKPIIMGLETPPAHRLTSDQSCVRTIDIDRVGTNNRTLTYFHMLGSWSIGDYWKDRGLAFALELLTHGFGLDQQRFAVTVFEGDSSIPPDYESAEIWRSLGISDEQIHFRPAQDNLWSMGETGPCGPCTEVFYDRGEQHGPDARPGDEMPRFVEIWNAGVFMTYNRGRDGTLYPLDPRVIDTGAGLERLTAVLQGRNSVYEVFPLDEIGDIVVSLASVQNEQSKHIISDHIRAASYIADEGVLPGNKLHGYVLRRLTRRAIYNAELLGITACDALFKECLQVLQKDKPLRSMKYVEQTMVMEHRVFQQTLHKGRRELDKIIAEHAGDTLAGQVAFRLYDTFGFPIELTQEILGREGIAVDIQGYHLAREKHRAVSRAGIEGKFAGGLAETTDNATKYHTATHLLHQSLRIVLGEHVRQAGSHITDKRLRFDFAHETPLTPEEIRRVEQLINHKIDEDIPVVKTQLPYEEAIQRGALSFFDRSQYPPVVSVYSVGDFSIELCRGPHVDRTGEIGHIRITEEQSSARGVRRIYAEITDE